MKKLMGHVPPGGRSYKHRLGLAIIYIAICGAVYGQDRENICEPRWEGWKWERRPTLSIAVGEHGPYCFGEEITVTADRPQTTAGTAINVDLNRCEATRRRTVWLNPSVSWIASGSCNPQPSSGNGLAARFTPERPGLCTITFTAEAETTNPDDSFSAYASVEVAVLKVDIDPTFDIVTDGADSETFTATVTPSGLSGLTYEWTWSAEPGAANNPSVTFSSPNASATTIEQSHWYALPDDVCDANGLSTYTLTCTVKHNGQPVCSATADLSVTLLEPAGYTTPPLLQGGPSIAYDSGQGLYYVSGVGTLSRIPASVDVYLPAASQFWTKTEAHENQHKEDFDNGYDSHEFVTVAEFYARIQNFTNATQAGLAAQILAEAQAYAQDETDDIDSVRGCLEIRAYQVGDSIAPQYHYHNCGQYTCP